MESVPVATKQYQTGSTKQYNNTLQLAIAKDTNLSYPLLNLNASPLLAILLNTSI